MSWITIAMVVWLAIFAVLLLPVFLRATRWRLFSRPVAAWTAFCCLGVGLALAQAVVLPRVQNITAGDAVSIIPGGNTSARSVYASPGDIAGQEKYSYQIPVTAFAITVPNFISLLYLNPAGTLATGTLTLQANPSDRQKFCLQDTQTQTAITIAASTGQTLAAGTFGLATPTALVANTRYCWLFLGALSTWTRTQ